MAHNPDLGQEIMRSQDVNAKLAELSKQAVAQPLDGSPPIFPQETKEPQGEPSKLTVASIEEADKSFDETFDVTLSDGHTITLRKRFRKTEVLKLGDELVEGLNSLGLLGVRPATVTSAYIMFLAIKHFSDLEIPNDIERQLVILNMLIDSDLLGEIFNSFDEEQRRLLDKYLSEFANGIRIVTAGLETAKVDEALNSKG